MRDTFVRAAAIVIFVGATALWAQVQAPPAPWRGAGPTPCVGVDGGVYQCPPAPRSLAVRAGRLFDSKNGQMLTNQVVLISGERITDLGPESRIKIPAGVDVIDLSHVTVLPGLIDAHTHMFNNRGPKATTESSMLIAVQNVQADLRAGFTAARDMSSHGNGYGDVEIRNAINQGRFDGPRYQVSTLGIVWGAAPANPAAPDNPLASTVVRSVEDARAAVREQIARGADWIKLFPAGAYSFTPTGQVQYQVTYPLPVVQALVDETHRLGKKAGCHVYGGEGQKNAIVAGCDTIEHGWGLDQEQVNMMVAKGLYFDPTLVRYSEPYMDDNDAKNTGGKYRVIPILEKAAAMAAATKGLNVMMGSGVDGSTFAHGTQALEFEALVKHAGLTPSRAIQSGTTINAMALGWQDQIGSIDKGKFADMIAVTGDPLAHITELQRVRFVMKGGKVIKNDVTAATPAGAPPRPVSAREVPRFQVDPSWPKIPNNWQLGQVASVAIDAQDHVWVLQRPGTLSPEEKPKAAPPLLEFDAAGTFIQAWGGPGHGYEWPNSEHGVYVDPKGFVWIGGNGAKDNHILKFTKAGKFVMQIGHAGQSKGNADTHNLNQPADTFVYAKTNELLVADGYGNRRVIVFDADTGKFKRMWGAFGNVPTDAAPNPALPDADEKGASQFVQPVHAARVSNDGLVYVSDRGGKRVQVFTLEGKYITQVFIGRDCKAPECGNGTTAASTAFSPDKEQRFLYVGNRSQAKVMVFNRKTLELLDSFGQWGSAPGQFGTLHHMAADSKGNLYVTEVTPLKPENRRIQKFTFMGLTPAK